MEASRKGKMLRQVSLKLRLKIELPLLMALIYIKDYPPSWGVTFTLSRK